MVSPFINLIHAQIKASQRLLYPCRLGFIIDIIAEIVTMNQTIAKVNGKCT